MLLDSVKIQEEYAAFKQKRHYRERRKGRYPEIPLYTKGDAEASFPFFSSIKYQQKSDLRNNIIRPECTILFAGYQAVGTLGRQIVDGVKTVRIHGQHYPVKVNVIKVGGFSAHADKDELLQWISAFKNNPPCKVFITHGEEEVLKTFAEVVEQELGFITERPSRGDKYVLD